MVGGEADHLTPAGGRPPRYPRGLQRAPRHRHGRQPHGRRVFPGTAQRGEPVLEDDHVVVVGGDLGQPAVPGRVERALLGRRQERTVLALGGDDHPFPGQGVPPEPGRGQIPGRPVGVSGFRRLARAVWPVAQRPPVRCLGPAQARRLVVVDDLAPVRQPGAFLPEQISAHGTHTVAGLGLGLAHQPCSARQASQANSIRRAATPAGGQVTKAVSGSGSSGAGRESSCPFVPSAGPARRTVPGCTAYTVHTSRAGAGGEFRRALAGQRPGGLTRRRRSG